MEPGMSLELSKLRLTEEEEEILEINDDIPEEKKTEIALSLVGHLLTKTTFNSRVMRNNLKNVWRSEKGIVMRELEENLFLFQFFCEEDKQYVLNEGPWSFDNKLLLLKEWQGTEQYSDIVFSTARFWVKAYDVPAVRQTEAFAKILGDKVGQYVGCDSDTMCGIDKSLCFRVDVDVTKPLRRGIMVKISGKSLWIRFKYLKLPDFCYGCGKVDHVLRGCDSIDPKTPVENLQYGEWMRASPRKSKRRNAAAELQEEKKLYLAFKGQGTRSHVRQRLAFTNPNSEQQGNWDHQGKKKATEDGMNIDEIEVGREVFKRKKEGEHVYQEGDSGFALEYEKTLSQMNGEQAEVASQLRRAQ